MDKAKTAPQCSRRKTVAFLLILFVLVISLVIARLGILSHEQSPVDRLAQQFYRIDDRGLHWNYKAMLKAYQECRDSTYQQQLLDLMVVSRAVHLVPDIIASISSGGAMDTERKIRTIIKLTGHDFSKDFDVASVAQQSVAEDARARLYRWWIQYGQGVLEVRGPKETFHAPNDWSALALTLATEKPQYLELEPIRLTATLENRSDTWYTFRYKRPEHAFKLEFLRVVDANQTVKISEMRYPGAWIVGGNASRRFAHPGYFVIDPSSSHVTQQWVNSGYGENLFSAGKVTLRAVLTPLHGKHKGRQLVSNDLQIDVVKPQGEDAAAHQFLTGTQAVDVGNGLSAGPEFVRFGGLVRNSSSSYNSAADDYFVNTYSGSLYAWYVRYTQADAAKWYADSAGSSQFPNPQHSRARTQLVKRLAEVIQNAPRDFPLLADAYADLLEYYKKTGELDKMTAIAETVRLDELKVVDRRLSERLTALVAYPNTIAASVHRKDSAGRTSLHKAAEDGPAPLVRFLIAEGADVNVSGEWASPLHVAAQAGRKEIVEILIASGADINAVHDHRTPLFWPVVQGHKEIVEVLLAHGAEVNVTDERDKTLVESANLHRHQDVLQTLIRAKGQGGRTPLHWAVEQGRRAMVHMLLKNGARLDAKDDMGRTALDIARALAHDDNDRLAILSLMEEYAATGNSRLP